MMRILLVLFLVLCFCGTAFATAVTIVPDGDVSVAWTKSEGSDNHSCVDDATCGGTTDRVSTNTATSSDIYSLSDYAVPVGETVIDSVVLVGCAGVGAAGAGKYLKLQTGLVDWTGTFTDSVTVVYTTGTAFSHMYLGTGKNEASMDAAQVFITAFALGTASVGIVTYVNVIVYSSAAPYRRRVIVSN